MKAAVTCIYEEKDLSISDALELRESSGQPLYFTCISCGEMVKPHKEGNNNAAHFEHYERNYSCPHSEGKSLKKDLFGINDQRAIEGYEQDKKILSGSRNQTLAKQCKVRDKFTCQVCKFKLKLNGKYVIECHHKYPLGKDGERETSLNDLVSLCPTCHRIAHTRKKPLDADEILDARKNSNKKGLLQ